MEFGLHVSTEARGSKSREFRSRARSERGDALKSRWRPGVKGKEECWEGLRGKRENGKLMIV